MGEYLLPQQRETYHHFLKIFDRDNYYCAESKKDDYQSLVDYIDRYKIVDFFVLLLTSFKLEEHLSNSVFAFRTQIKQWNQRNAPTKIDETALFQKYYVLRANDRVIINPEIINLLNNSEYEGNAELEFLTLFSESTYQYPLLKQQTWEPLLDVHNKNRQYKLTKEILLGENKDLHSAIFHNYKNLKDVFFEALQTYISSINYKRWKENISHYFYLLVELNNAEIYMQDIIASMDKNKQKILADFSFERLLVEKDIFSIEDFNFLMRLKYVPYEVKGVDILSPGKSSRIVPYNTKKYSKNNGFETLKNISHFYDDSEFHLYFTRLITEVRFVFRYFRDIITYERWEKLLTTVDSNVYKYFFNVYILSKSNNLLRFKTVVLAPVIIEKIFSLEENYYWREQTIIDIDKFKESLLKYYINHIDDNSESYFKLLLEFYFDLPTQQGIYGQQNYSLKKIIRTFVIEKVINCLKSKDMPDKFCAIFKTRRRRDDFAVFDVLIEYSKSNFSVRKEIVRLIIDEYRALLSEDKFYSAYFKFNGIENVLFGINELSLEEIRQKLLSFNFIDGFKTFNSQDSIDWGKCLDLSKKLRFHLGILASFVEEYDLSSEIEKEITAYILHTYKELKGYSISRYRPLSWESIVEDTFEINGSKAIETNQILTDYIIQVLKRKDTAYICNFVKDIEQHISFSEGVLFLNHFKTEINIELDKLFPVDLKGTSLGMAEREAFFLVRSGYAEEALVYISYLKKLEKEYKGLSRYKDYWLLLEFEALLSLKRYDQALVIIDNLSDKRKNDAREGLVQYLKKNYSLAKQLFERCFKHIQPELGTIVNYSAVLISLGENAVAIEWCEKYISEFEQDYLLNANLACAYAEIDKIKSLYYFHIAKNIKPDYAPALHGILDNINELVNDLPDLLKNVDIFKEKTNLSNNIVSNLQGATRKILNLSIPELETKIIKDINKTIQLLSETPVNLKRQSENELSDLIKNNCKMSMDHYGIEITREPPQGFAKKSSGEFDFFLYKSGVSYENVATGENKEWSPAKFEKQLKQLLGYLRAEGGFGFTIIFNKNTRLETVLKGREKKLDEFTVIDQGVKIFEKEGPVIDMADFSQGLNGVLLTCHKNPEKENSLVRIYHFVINAYLQEREEVAKQARR